MAVSVNKEPGKFNTHLAIISHANKVMLKILQVRLLQYVNRELSDVQAGFRKGKGTRDQIANICWVIDKARGFQKNIHFCFIYYANAFDCVDHNKLDNSERDGNTRPPGMLSCFNCVLLFATLWTVALQVPLSMGFSRQEY